MNQTTYLTIFFITLIIFIIFAILFGYVYYYRVVKPINILKIAIKNMITGNVQNEIDSDVTGNFTELFKDFEELRLWLHSLLIQQEENDIITQETITNISHDLKTPLTAIKGYAEGILDGLASSPDRLEKYIQTIYTKANDMSLLVDELSFFNHINQQNVQYDFSVININKYISECIGDSINDLEMKKIHLLFRTYADQDAKVRIDTSRLKRVINNILSNSTKYIDHEHGVVFVEIHMKKDSFIISFEDNGVGMKDSELPYIFDRFYRTDSSRNSTTGGSGLGLAIAKKIVTDHGGTIWAESTLGKSTTLFIELNKYQEDTK